MAFVCPLSILCFLAAFVTVTVSTLFFFWMFDTLYLCLDDFMIDVCPAHGNDHCTHGMLLVATDRYVSSYSTISEMMNVIKSAHFRVTSVKKIGRTYVRPMKIQRTKIVEKIPFLIGSFSTNQVPIVRMFGGWSDEISDFSTFASR